MTFLRQKRSAVEDFDLRVLSFKVPEKAIQKFDVRYQQSGWKWNRDLEKGLNFKPHQLTVIREQDDQQGRPRYQALIPLEEGTWLKIGFCIDRNQLSLFVLYLAIDRRPLAGVISKLEEEWEVHFIAPRENPYRGPEWPEFLQRLAKLEPTQRRRKFDVQREVSTWNKYLEALEKVIEEKTVLLKVKEGKKSSQAAGRGRRGAHLVYELDPSGFWEAVSEDVGDQVLPIQVVGRGRSDEGGWVDVQGMEELDAEQAESISQTAQKGFHRLRKGPKGNLCRLDVQFKFRAHVLSVRKEAIAGLVEHVRGQGGRITSSDHQFKLESWHDYALLKQEVQNRPAVFRSKGVPTVRVRLDHRAQQDLFDDQLDYEETLQQLKDRLAHEISKGKGNSFAWPRAKVALASEKAFVTWVEGLRKMDAGLDIQLEEIHWQVGFQAFESSFRTRCLGALEKALQSAFGQHLGKMTRDKGRSFLRVSLGLKGEAVRSRTLQMLQEIGGEALTCEVENQAGYRRVFLDWDAPAFEQFLNARWQDLGNREVKFLSLSEKEAYEAEIAGKGGSYRGGEILGNLVQLRNGRAKVRLEDPDLPVGKLQSGFLLPVFLGDLAQHKRLKSAIRTVTRPRSGMPVNPHLANFIFDPAMARAISLQADVRSDHYWTFKHSLNQANLNEQQREAVYKALHAEDMVLIQGPPGTGKTTVIAEIIWQMLQENPESRILISSQAHLAVDNVLQRLYKRNLIRPIRIASSAYASKAVEPEGQRYVREFIEQWAKADQGSKSEKERHQNAVRSWMDRIPGKMEWQTRFFQPQKKWEQVLKAPGPDVKGFFSELYLKSVNVVAATCLECGRKDFKETYASGFDCVIVDEASKATPPELLLPLILGRKVVILGDHKQLPPMVDTRRIEEVLREIGAEVLANEMEEIETSQFEKLFQGADASIRITLTQQYRMHRDIMQVINAFYKEEGGLICGIEGQMDRKDLSDKGSRWHGIGAWPIDPNTHVLWVDVQHPEVKHRLSFSNPGEVEVIRNLLEKMEKDPGFQQFQRFWSQEGDREIGMVSFYGKQVEKLKQVVNEFKGRIPIRLRTVDKFQGMERNIMIVSTVRSQTQILEGQTKEKARPNKSIGFAKDYRRINVAFSRARRLLIIVGDESHFSRANPNYQHIKRVIGRQGGRIEGSQIK